MKPISPMEGHILATVWRNQPTTAYFVRRSFDRSLSTDISSSPGGVYPALKRLKDQNFIEARIAEDDRRGTELLSLTKAGEAAMKNWLIDVPSAALLPEDPLRTRIIFVDFLEPSERLEWLKDVRQKLRTKMNELTEAMLLEHPLTATLAYENARAQTQARLLWTDHVIAELVVVPGESLLEP